MPRGRRSTISSATRIFLSFLKTVTAPHSPSCPHAVSLHFNLLTITAPSVFLPAPLFCHPERSGGSTIAPAQSIRLFLSFRPRRAESPPSGEILRGAYQKTSAFTPPSASHDGESRRRSRRMRGVHFHVPPPLPSPHTSKRKLKTDGSLARHTIPRRNSRSRHHYIPCFRAFSSPPASFFLLS